MRFVAWYLGLPRLTIFWFCFCIYTVMGIFFGAGAASAFKNRAYTKRLVIILAVAGPFWWIVFLVSVVSISIVRPFYALGVRIAREDKSMKPTENKEN